MKYFACVGSRQWNKNKRSKQVILFVVSTYFYLATFRFLVELVLGRVWVLNLVIFGRKPSYFFFIGGNLVIGWKPSY